MYNVFAWGVLPLFVISTYYFNKKKLKGTSFKVFQFSLVEATCSFLVVALLFLQGFLSHFYLLSSLVIIILVVCNILFRIGENKEVKADLQIETVKNNLVFFCLTILPFYVFLTIFRFLDPYFQIPLAILITAFIFYLSFLFKRLASPHYKNIPYYYSMLPRKHLVSWAAIFIIATSFIIFQSPKNIVSDSLNLSNNVKFFSYEDIPTDVNNNFTQEEILQIDSSIQLNSKITDYYYDDYHLYIYTNRGSLIIYDLSTKEIVYETLLENLGGIFSDENNIIDNELHNKFIFYEGHLVLLGLYNTYLVSSGGAVVISDLSHYNSRYYYQDNELYFLSKESSNLYNIYKFDNGAFTLTETINTNNEVYDSLLIISESLFYQENNKYVLYIDESKTFNIGFDNPLYGMNNQVMYTSFYEKVETEYQIIEANSEISTISLRKMHNSIGIVIDDYVYFFDNREPKNNVIEIFNEDLEYHAIFNLLESEPFWINNFYLTSYTGSYQEKDNNLEFIQVEENNKHIVITVYQVIERDVAVILPFYSHYGIWIFIPILIAFFIPITNYRESKTTIVPDKDLLKKEEEVYYKKYFPYVR